MIENLLLLVGGFIIGSIPFGVIIARAFHIGDLQARGSGNIGATNVSRVAGFWPAGAMTFLLDVFKGILPVSLVSLPVAQSFWSDWWQKMGHSGVEITALIVWLVGFAAVAGHCFSPWVKFKGGKGVATGFGVVLALTPIAALGGILVFAFTFFKSRVGSLASISGLFTVVIIHLTLQAHPSESPSVFVLAAIVFLILIRHESNIDGLLKGKERSFR